MTNQKELWDAEYLSKGLPTSYRNEPSRGALVLVEFLKRKNIPISGKLLDLGCGAGRNGVYFARLGFEVYGMDNSENALQQFRERIEASGMHDRIKLFGKSISERFPFPDRYFDIEFDGIAFCHLTENKDREIFKKELLRVLKHSGYFLSYVLAKDYGNISKLQDENGIYTNSVNKTMGKLYSEGELIEFFSPEFECISSENIKKEEVIHGEKFLGSLIVAIFQKK